MVIAEALKALLMNKFIKIRYNSALTISIYSPNTISVYNDKIMIRGHMMSLYIGYITSSSNHNKGIGRSNDRTYFTKSTYRC
ncbi:MAG: hypothetical protein DYG89_17975 [Caldilinea sp. CFX5]|nr:hypothetical protein [Caldilinea sp. CFX5]